MTSIDYYGYSVDVWVVDDGLEYIYFTRSSGILLKVEDYNASAYIEAEFTNVIPEYDIHNQLVFIDSVLRGSPGVTTTIDVFIYNTGEFMENSIVFFMVDGNYSDVYNVTLNSFDWMWMSFDFTPPDYGIYNISIWIEPVIGEHYTQDNYFNRPLTVVELNNYNLSNPSYNWYDAMNNGFNLNLYGDDISTAVDLSFPFTFYDSSFATVYVSSNGWLSFYETDPWQFWSDPIPTEEHPYMVAPFFSDLIAEGNIYAWITPEFVTIEFHNYYYLWGDLAGTFEVVFFADGTILFQYQSISYDDTATKGLNYGFDLNYFTRLSTDLGGMRNYAALFTLAAVPGEEGPDLVADLEIPYPLNPGDSDFITAIARNEGSETMYNVEMFLYLDDELVGRMTTDVLAAGDEIALNYYWMNMPYGQHKIDVDITEQASEVNFANNHLTQIVFVSDEHDLWVWVNAYEMNSALYIDATVYNQGYVDEHDVELQIILDGQMVTFGQIDFLPVATSSVVSYIWQKPTEGIHNITAFAPLIEPELDETNNQYTIFYEISVDTFVLQLFDAQTNEAVPYAYVYLYGYDSGLNINTNTNSSGGLTLNIPEGNYYLYIQAEGYYGIESYIYVSGLSYFVYYMDPIVLDSLLTVQVFENGTGDPVANADVNIYGWYTGYYAYASTNASGGVEIPLPTDMYDISIYADGYYEYYSARNISGMVYLEIYLVPIVFDSVLTVEVLDSQTGQPIANAGVDLWGQNTGYSTYTLTNLSGMVQVDLPSDYFDMWVSARSYHDYYNTTYVSGHVFITVYLEPFVLDSVVAIHVIKANTSEPVINANIDLNGIYTGFYGYIQTNSSGLAQIAVPEDDYYIYISAAGYVDYEFEQYVAGTVFIEISLIPLDTNFSITIEQPTTNETIAGGQVYVSYSVDAPNDPNFIDVYVNDQYVTTVVVTGELLVPVFTEGVNFIELVAYWSTGSASDTVSVITTDLQPVISWEIGDTINVNYQFIDGTDTVIQFNFTVIDQITEFVYLLNLTYVQAEPGNPVIIEYHYITVNILNGYIGDSDMWWVNHNFYMIAGTGVGTIPTSVPLWDWGNAFYYNFTTTIDGQTAYVYNDIFGYELIYLDNGLLYRMEFPGYLILTIDTSITTENPPEMTSPADMSYEYGSTGNQITWEVTSTTQMYYNLTMDGVLQIFNVPVMNGTIVFNVDGLSMGDHYVDVTVYDTTGHIVWDEVIVTVIDTTPPTVNNPDQYYEIYEGENATVGFNLTDSNPAWYYLLLDGELVFNETWSGEIIWYTFTDLMVGNYTVILIAVDTSDNWTNATAFISVLDIDLDAPVVTGPVDFTYEEGSTKNVITWNIEEESSSTYVVYKNGEFYESGDVTDNQVLINIDGLKSGRYNFTIVVTDSSGNIGSDEVIVYVISNITHPKTPGFSLVYAILSLLGLMFIIRRRRLP